MKNRMLLVCVVVATGLSGQSPVVYNAARGTTPVLQCFTEVGAAGTFRIQQGELRCGPTPANGFGYMERTGVSMDFDSSFEMEASFRVISSGCRLGATLPVRYGIQMSAVDDNGSFCAAHFCDTHVALVNDPNLAPDGVNVVTAPFPVAGNSILARVQVDAQQATLFLNNAPVLSVPRGTYRGPSRSLYFGDGTLALGADFAVSYFRASGSALGCSPTSIAHVGSGCAGLGTLDVSGILQPGMPVALTVSVPRPPMGGFAVMVLGPYAMQSPYCGAGCRFGMDLNTAIVEFRDSLPVVLPASSVFVGVPFAFQGARLGILGPCGALPAHQVSDVMVMTL